MPRTRSNVQVSMSRVSEEYSVSVTRADSHAVLSGRESVEGS